MTVNKTIIQTILIMMLMFTSSCGLSYRINYTASYDIENNKISSNSKEISNKIINEIADEFHIHKDSRYNGLDTLGYFGSPYHYFKFIITDNDSVPKNISLNYTGVFGKRKNPPYKQLLSNFNDSIICNFQVITQEIVSESNEKKE